MVVKRKIDTKTLRPGGIDGEEHADQVSDSVNALWETSGGILTSVGGNANLITANLKYSTDFAAYTEPLVCKFKAVSNNTGSVQVNLNNLGAKFIKRVNGDALIAGDILIDVWYSIFYSATDDVFIISQIGSPTLPSTQNVKQIWTAPLFEELIAGTGVKTVTSITGVTAEVGDVIMLPILFGGNASGEWDDVQFNNIGGTLSGTVTIAVYKNTTKLWNIGTVAQSNVLGDAIWQNISYDTSSKHFHTSPYAILVDDTNANDYSIQISAFNGSSTFEISYSDPETWKHIKSTVTI